MKTLFKLFFLFAAVIIFSSCATSGPKYVELYSSIPVVPDTGRIFYIVKVLLERQFSRMSKSTVKSWDHLFHTGFFT